MTHLLGFGRSLVGKGFFNRDFPTYQIQVESFYIENTIRVDICALLDTACVSEVAIFLHCELSGTGSSTLGKLNIHTMSHSYAVYFRSCKRRLHAFSILGSSINPAYVGKTI